MRMLKSSTGAQGRQSVGHHHRPVSDDVDGVACSVCGSNRYYLVLHAEALSSRSGVSKRCSRCHARIDLVDETLRHLSFV